MKKIITSIFILVLCLFYASTLSPDDNDTPYVILISFDGFRWDYANRGITPNLHSMKNNGVAALSLQPVFPSKTFPNHISIITGLVPIHHGILQNDFIDPFHHKRYKVGDIESVRDAKWYQGEAFWETAERQGIITASYFWPGSELELDYRRPTYFERYEHFRPYQERIDQVIEWLTLPESKRPHFITLYFDATDSDGHTYGPESTQTNNAIKRLDNILGTLFDELKQHSLLNVLNIIVVSDHGMTEVSSERTIDVSKLLTDQNCSIQGNGVMMMIDCDKNQIQKVYSKLKSQEDHYNVYLKKNVPNHLHFSKHPYISPLILIADPGWQLLNGANAMSTFLIKGDHGYDNHYIDMHGIFFAMGPAFKKNYSTGTLWNIDIYPLLCRIFNIYPGQIIDGKLNRIEFILKED